MEEYYELQVMPGYEINRRGDVRNIVTQVPLKKLSKKDSGYLYYNRNKRSFSINALLEETFGAGAAVAAGFSAPNMNKVNRARGIPKKRGIKVSRYTRKCTDCGAPTNQYRCEMCWGKRRGFGFSDITETTVARSA